MLSLKEKLHQFEDLQQEILDKIFDLKTIFNNIIKVIIDYPDFEVPFELFDLNKNYCKLNENIENQISKSQQNIQLVHEYQKTLQDLQEIIQVAEQLVVKPIHVNHFDELKEIVQKNRTFFMNLNQCKNLLESLENNLDCHTKDFYYDLHTNLHDKSVNVFNKAADKFQALSSVITHWKCLDYDLINEQKWIKNVSNSNFDFNFNSIISSTNSDQLLLKYQQLKHDSFLHEIKLLQLHSIIRKLNTSVYCFNIEKSSNELLDLFYKTKTRIFDGFQTLNDFQNNWIVYQQNTDKIINWLHTVDSKIKELDNLSKSDSISNFADLNTFWVIYTFTISF